MVIQMSATETDAESGVTSTVEDRIEEQRERVEEATEDARETVEEQIEDGLDTVNQNVVDALSLVLDTGARADVYVALRGLDEATIDEIAEQSGLYPEKVEETLDQLEDDEVVTSDTVGGETFYEAVAPTDIVRTLPSRLSDRVSDVFDVETDDGDRRVLSPGWAPFRMIIEPKETEDETEIAVE